MYVSQSHFNHAIAAIYGIRIIIIRVPYSCYSMIKPILTDSFTRSYRFMVAGTFCIMILYTYSPDRALTISVWKMKCGSFTLIPTPLVHWSSLVERLCGVALGRPSQLSDWSKA